MSKPEAILAFDFGTSYFKTGVLDVRGRLIALHREAAPILSPQPGWFEMSAEDLFAAVRRACAALAAHLPQVRAVTYSSQANTFALLDASNRPLTPLVVWSDERAIAGRDRFAAMADEPAFRHETGLALFNHQFTPAKVDWLAKHHPAVFQRTKYINWLPGLFTLWLTGRHTTDGSIAGFSGWFDVPAWRWRPSEFVQFLPEVVRPGSVIGDLRPEIATELGLPTGCKVVAGCLDQYAGALGVGNSAAGMISETTGTVLTTVACSPVWGSGTGSIFRGPGPTADVYFHMTVGEVSANLLEHYRRTLGGQQSFEELCAGVAEETLRLDERQPLEAIKQTLTRWTVTESRAAVVRAIFSAVARALATQLRQLSPTPPREIRCAGGAARNADWLRIKADLIGVPMVAPVTPEPALLGAASLAAAALGWPDMNIRQGETRIFPTKSADAAVLPANF